MIGKQFQHPLQSKVDRVVFLNLGDMEDWQIGDVIRLDRFDHIRNKPYIRQRLECLGFTLCSNGSEYKYIGDSEPEAPIIRTKSDIELASIALSEDELTLQSIRQMLSNGVVINSSELTRRSKKKLNWIISTLKTIEGVDIKPTRVNELGDDFMIYTTAKNYLDIVGDLVEITKNDVINYLEKHGEMTAASVGVSSGKLGRWIYEMRAVGWQIESIGIGQRRKVTYKLISKP